MIIEIHKSDDGHTWRYIDIVSKAVLYTIRIEKAARTSMTGKKKSKFTAYRGEACASLSHATSSHTNTLHPPTSGSSLCNHQRSRPYYRN